MEWLEATRETASASIGDYVGSVRDAIAQIGEPVHLVGDCQGGWLAAVVAALDPALGRVAHGRRRADRLPRRRRAAARQRRAVRRPAAARPTGRSSRPAAACCAAR